jgi:hypothetical protein
VNGWAHVVIIAAACGALGTLIRLAQADWSKPGEDRRVIVVAFAGVALLIGLAALVLWLLAGVIFS